MITIQFLSVAILPLIFAITVHEAAHGWVASRLGDDTAFQQGRLTLNPIPHIDPVGTLLVPMLLLFAGGFLFGWAKPVPVNARNFSSPRRDFAVVAVAGPASNLLMALLWALLWKINTVMFATMPALAEPLARMAEIGIFLNLALMLLNLLPLPPLDGGRVLTWLLPERLAMHVDRIERFGIFILLGLLFLGLWEHFLGPILANLFLIIVQLVGV